MKLKIVRVDPTLPLPEYHTAGAVAFDFYTRVDATIAPHATMLFPSNFIIEVPPGYFLMIAARSSTHKKGLIPANGVGVIDQDYHGPQDEIRLVLHNFTDQPVTVQKGDRLAQGIIIPIVKPEWEEVTAIKEESRGGFGSTG